ncbi:MAG: M28 family metallopeptidase [Bacillota bacterium]
MNDHQTSYAWRYLTDLTELLPHRASASEAELRAADWLTERLQYLGYTVERQEFTAPRDTLYAGPPFVFLGVLAAASVGVAWPLVGAALAILFSLPMIGDMLGKPWDFDLLLSQHRSRNVVARRGDGGKPPRLVIMAHYDTQKGSLLFHPRFAPFITPLFTLAYLCLAVIPAALILRAVWPAASWTGLVVWVAGLVLLAVAAFLTLCRYTGRYINGANDNGSGTAVALALAQRLAEAGDENAGDVVFVFTGSEEVGERGAKHYFRTAGKGLSPQQTRVVNLDNIGGGRLHYLLGEGMLAYKPYDRELIALAERRAAQEESGFLTPVKNLLLPTDGLMATVYGFRAITFISMDEQGRIPHYHWHTDVLDNVDRDLVEREEALLWRYVGDVRKKLEQAG